MLQNYYQEMKENYKNYAPRAHKFKNNLLINPLLMENNGILEKAILMKLKEAQINQQDINMLVVILMVK